MVPLVSKLVTERRLSLPEHLHAIPPSRLSKSTNLRPVLFFIHGGGFTGGEGSDGIFDGGNAASRSDVVVVTINYR